MTVSTTWETEHAIVQRAYRMMRKVQDLISNKAHPINTHWEYFLHRLEEKTRELWQDSTSWECQMCHLSRQYVRGYLPCHPGYDEPIWEETKAIEPGLLSLHDFAILTTYSEPGLFKYDRENFSIRKRPHLFFMLPTRATNSDQASIRRFLEALRASGSIWHHIRYHYTSDHFPGSSSRLFSEYSGQPVTNVPGPDDEKFACEQVMEENEWEDESFQVFPSPRNKNHRGTGGLKDYDHPFQSSLAVDPLQVCIVSREYTTSDNQSLNLQTLVVELLDRAGLPRLSQPESLSADDQDVAGSDNEREPEYCQMVVDMLGLWAEEAQDQDLANGVPALVNPYQGAMNDQGIAGPSGGIISNVQASDDKSVGTLMAKSKDEVEAKDPSGR